MLKALNKIKLAVPYLNTAIIGIGIVLRLVMYFQNRNLIIDEANVARNLFERDFIQLLAPLKYEQYAPPIFLWVEKFLALTFGIGEMSLKLFPLYCGVAMLFLFHSLLKKIIDPAIAWFPLALLAFSPYMIEFSTTIKQYISDAFIILLLIWLALKIDLIAYEKRKFVLLWSAIGVVAMLSSMPAVFVLASIGFYYAWHSFKEKKYNHIGLLLVIGAIWLGAFGIYYITILKPQITSDYLQNYHADYFLYATPGNKEEWQHNLTRLLELLSNTSGHTFLSQLVSGAFLVVAFIFLVRRRVDLLILFFGPVLFTLIAAALNQFSLITRVSLFLLPLLLLIFCIGLNEFWKIKSTISKITISGIAVVMILGFNRFILFKEKFGFHEITVGLDYLNRKHVVGNHVFIHDASLPTYIYYTELHPQREKYATLLGAHRMKWDSDFTEETRGIKDTVYFIYTGGFPEPEKQKRTQQIEQNMKQIDYFEKYICFVYGYAPKGS